MNRQDIFNKVVTGIVNQGGLSYTTDPKTDCDTPRYYNHENGHMCAIGLLVGEETAKELEQACPRQILGQIYSSNSYFKKKIDKLKDVDVDISFLNSIQRIHDDAMDSVNRTEYMNNFMSIAQNISETFNLEMPEGV